jgi:hypothetical protein
VQKKLKNYIFILKTLIKISDFKVREILIKIENFLISNVSLYMKNVTVNNYKNLIQQINFFVSRNIRLNYNY